MDTINLSSRLTKTHIAARFFDEGDHWQKGEAFLPFANLDISKQNEQRAQMEKSLETENIIGEVLDNEQNAVLGREPDWQAIQPGAALLPYTTTTSKRIKTHKKKRLKLSPDKIDAAQLFSDETEEALLEYWNDYNLLADLKEANRRAGTQEAAFIRAFVPKGLLTGADKKSDLRSAMDLLRFEVLSADKGGVFLDEETHRRYGLFKKQTKDGKSYTELIYVEGGKTYVKTITQTDYAALAGETLASLKNYMPTDKSVTDEESFDLGGELLYYEIRRKPLITESVISNQKDVNLCLTMKNRLTYQAANRDFEYFNTQKPKDKDGNEAPVKRGGRAANFYVGEPIYKTDGAGKPTGEITGYATPSMQIIDPADPEPIIKSKEASAFAIYNQTSQVHLTKNESAAASGASKRESRFSFEKKCGDLKQIIDPAGRWMLKVLTLFSADNLEQSEKYKSLRFDFNCRIDAGAPDAEEIKQAAQDVKDGNLSWETYTSQYRRSDDADAEKTRLADSESYQIAMWNKRLETAKLAADIGLPPSEYIQILYPGDEAKQKEVLPKIEKPVVSALPMAK